MWPTFRPRLPCLATETLRTWLTCNKAVHVKFQGVSQSTVNSIFSSFEIIFNSAGVLLLVLHEWRWRETNLVLQQVQNLHVRLDHRLIIIRKHCLTRTLINYCGTNPGIKKVLQKFTYPKSCNEMANFFLFSILININIYYINWLYNIMIIVTVMVL